MELHGGKSHSPTWNFRGPRQGPGFLTEAQSLSLVWNLAGWRQGTAVSSHSRAPL